jgi:hypothetical protein
LKKFSSGFYTTDHPKIQDYYRVLKDATLANTFAIKLLQKTPIALGNSESSTQPFWITLDTKLAITEENVRKVFCVPDCIKHITVQPAESSDKIVNDSMNKMYQLGLSKFYEISIMYQDGYTDVCFMILGRTVEGSWVGGWQKLVYC